ncbi:MAG: hypothetical protein ACYSYU_00140 [Planctomycetota bacterium]|jgi:hypothetical protein
MNNSGCGTLIAGFFALVLFMGALETIGCTGGSGGYSSSDSEIDDIIAAKAYVRAQLNYPDTADFHDLKTRVTSTHVHLTVTAKNAFGVPSTHEFSVPR